MRWKHVNRSVGCFPSRGNHMEKGSFQDGNPMEICCKLVVSMWFPLCFPLREIAFFTQWSEIEEGKLDSLNQVRNWEDVFAVFFSVVRAYHSNPFGFKRSYMSSLQRVNFFTSRYVDIVSVDSSGNIAIQQQQHHQQQHLHSINTDKNNNNNNFISRHKRQHTTQYIIKEVR